MLSGRGHSRLRGKVRLQTIRLHGGVKLSGRVVRPAGSHAVLAATLIPNPKTRAEGIRPDSGRDACDAEIQHCRRRNVPFRARPA